MASSESPTTLEQTSQPIDKLPQRKQRIWLWLLLALIPIAGGGVAWYLLNRQNNQPQSMNQPQEVSVTLQRVKTGLAENSSQFVGTLEAQNKATLRAEIEGRIIAISAQAGDIVRRGAPIMQLRLDRNRAELNAATANINIQRAARDNAQAELRIAQAQLREAQENRDSSQADLQQEQAEVLLQEEELKRMQFLVTEGAESQQQLDIQTRNRDSAIAARDSARKKLNAAQAAIQTAQENIAAARAKFDQENATVKQAQAQVEVINEDLKDTKIEAPIAGIMGDIALKVGDYVSIGQQLTTITQNQALELRLPIPTERAADLSLGLPVEIISSQGKSVARGQISFISPQVNTDAQTVLAKARFPNPEGRLRSEQLVRAKVIWETNPSVFVPITAVSRLGNQNFVFVAVSEQGQRIAQQKPVKLGNVQGNNYQVLEGVKSGELIVTSGILNLSDGTPIVAESTNSPE